MVLIPNHYFYKLLEKNKSNYGIVIDEVAMLLHFWNTHFEGCKINLLFDVQAEQNNMLLGTLKMFIYSRGTLEQKYFFHNLKFNRKYFI